MTEIEIEEEVRNGWISKEGDRKRVSGVRDA